MTCIGNYPATPFWVHRCISEPALSRACQVRHTGKEVSLEASLARMPAHNNKNSNKNKNKNSNNNNSQDDMDKPVQECPNILDFSAVTDDRSDGSDKCNSLRTCKAPIKSPPPTHQHSVLHRPDALHAHLQFSNLLDFNLGLCNGR